MATNSEAKAAAELLARLLIVCICQDRFVEGALEAATSSGLLARILLRAAIIFAEIDTTIEQW